MKASLVEVGEIVTAPQLVEIGWGWGRAWTRPFPTHLENFLLPLP